MYLISLSDGHVKKTDGIQFNLSGGRLKEAEKVHGFERRTLVDSSSMFYITSHFDITLFVFFCCPLYVVVIL